MLKFSVLDQSLADVRAKKAKAEKLVQSLTAPQLELARLQQQEADLLTARQQAEQEAAQLEAERADLARDIDRLAYAKDVTALIKALEPADRYRSSRHRSSVYSQAIAALRDDHDTLQTYQQRLAGIAARLKQLGEG